MSKELQDQGLWFIHLIRIMPDSAKFNNDSHFVDMTS